MTESITKLKNCYRAILSTYKLEPTKLGPVEPVPDYWRTWSFFSNESGTHLELLIDSRRLRNLISEIEKNFINQIDDGIVTNNLKQSLSDWIEGDADSSDINLVNQHFRTFLNQ